MYVVVSVNVPEFSRYSLYNLLRVSSFTITKSGPLSACSILSFSSFSLVFSLVKSWL